MKLRRSAETEYWTPLSDVVSRHQLSLPPVCQSLLLHEPTDNRVTQPLPIH